MDEIEPFRFQKFSLELIELYHPFIFWCDHFRSHLIASNDVPWKNLSFQPVRFDRKSSYQKIKGWYSYISSKENSWNRNSSIYSKLKKRKGSISSILKSGRVLLVPNEIVEGFYLFRWRKWKGSICSKPKSGIVLFDPFKEMKGFY